MRFAISDVCDARSHSRLVFSQHLAMSSHVITTEFTWVIEKFDKLTMKETSPSYRTRNREWFLTLHPFGTQARDLNGTAIPAKTGYVSLFLNHRGSFPVNARFTLTVVDKYGKVALSSPAEVRHYFHNDNFGFPSFKSRSQLLRAYSHPTEALYIKTTIKVSVDGESLCTLSQSMGQLLETGKHRFVLRTSCVV